MFLDSLSVGTKSLLFGVHAFWWHPLTVWWAWHKLYGEWPDLRTCVCIFFHDVGYLGCKNMDGPEGQNHTELGARIVGRLFGPKYYDLVRWHSRHLSKLHGMNESKLCWPDKTSMLFDPYWFYVTRARLSGEIHEYRANAETRDGPDWCPMGASDRDWHLGLKTRLAELAGDYVRRLGQPTSATGAKGIHVQPTPRISPLSSVHPTVSRSESLSRRGTGRRRPGWR